MRSLRLGALRCGGHTACLSAGLRARLCVTVCLVAAAMVRATCADDLSFSRALRGFFDLLECARQDTYAADHTVGFREFLLRGELLKAIQDAGFEHPSTGMSGCTLGRLPVGGGHRVRCVKLDPGSMLSVSLSVLYVRV